MRGSIDLSVSRIDVLMTMKLWKNTTTLDALDPGLENTVSPEEAEIALIGGKPIDVGLFPNLRGIFKCGVGADNVPFEECARRGIEARLPSRDTAEIIYEETAAFAVSLIYRMLYAEVGCMAGWEKKARTIARKQTLLVVGMGNIGSRVAAKMEGTMRVIGYDIATPQAKSFRELLAEADIVTLHVPLTDKSRGMMGGAELAAMKNGAAIVNTARAALVDEGALYVELSSGRLRAAFDVFWQEPYMGKLLSIPPDRFYATPHVASASIDFLLGLLKDFRTFAKEVC